VHFDARNFLNMLGHALDMLDVDRRDHTDSRVENLHHVLPALGIAAAFDIGVRQFVHDHDLGMQVQDGLHVHLVELFSLIEELASGNQRQTRDEGLGLRTAVRLDIADLYVHPGIEQLMGLLQHAVGLSHTGAHADVDFEFSPVRPFDQLQKVLRTLSGFIHRLFACHCIEVPFIKRTISGQD